MDDSLALPPRLAALLDDLPLEQLAFTAVPVKPRGDGWTPHRQRSFIARLALLGGVATSAKAVGMSRESAYRLRQHPGAGSFAAAWDKAQSWGRGRAFDLAVERALHGEVRDVYYRGRKIGENVRHDNGLLIAALGAMAMEPVADAGAELARLLDEIDPAGAARSAAPNDFLPRSA
jgi:hypothetical protein